MPPKRNTENSKGLTSSTPEPDPSGIDSSLIELLNRSIGRLRTTLENHVINPDISDSNEIKDVVRNLITAVDALTDNLSNIQTKVEGLDRQFRIQEDELDEIKQRSMKGNIICSSLPNKKRVRSV